MQADPYSLDQLKDIVAPEPVSWWPLSPGWWFLVALGLLWAGVFAMVAVRRWRANAYRRQAIRELEEIKVGDFVELSTLLKRVALVAFRRDQVASLTGGDWLGFLDSTCQGVDFSHEPASRLGDASSTPTTAAINDGQWLAVVHSARDWINGHKISGPTVEGLS